MAGAVLETLLKRDRQIVAASLTILTVLAWAYLFFLNSSMIPVAPMPSMPGMDMPGMNMAPAPLAPIEFVFTFVMWSVMMVGMMTPSAAPMILLYAQVGRHARAQGKPFAPTGWFAGAYLVAWACFALLATLAQSLLLEAELLTPMLHAANNVFAGLMLIAAGIYQWTPLKNACLSQCQSPLVFLQRHGGFKSDSKGSLIMGLKHGAYCIGCCWALMTLLFVGGVMNLAWIAALSILVSAEKLVSNGRILSQGTGLVLTAAGVIFLLVGD